MRAPTDGLAGSLWRTISFPARAIAPLVLLARRAISGEYWTETVTETNTAVPRLTLTDRSDIQRPRDGAGPLNHRTYRVYIRDSIVSADQLLESFRRDPNRFSPTSFATFVPDPLPEGLNEGDTYEVKLPGPWDGPIHVRTVEPERVRLETLGGHMEAGWIEFRASDNNNVIDFTIESYARSGDPVFDALYHEVGIGKHFQSEMWVQVLEAVVAASGGFQQGRVDLKTIIYRAAEQ